MKSPAARTWIALVAVLVIAAGVLFVTMRSPQVQEVTARNPVNNPSPQPSESEEKKERPKSPYWSDPADVGQPYPPGTVSGLITFRGNPTRTYYGTGPVPRATPEISWRYPGGGGGMCGASSDEHGTQSWCGTGWTGQPSVFERDGKTWMIFGAYDYGVHFLNAETGKELLPTFKTGDIIKGSVTVDPDGYPLVYTGSRDNKYRILSFQGSEPKQLWSMSAYDFPQQWNDDWDSSGLIIDDYLFEGGENSQFVIVKLNRGYDKDGKVKVNPKVVFHTASYDSQLMSDFGGNATSVENSVAIYKDTVYFGNSAGLVQGWDISGLKKGEDPKRVFRFWTGDDTDASVVIDEEGYLYIGSEYEKGNSRSKQVGQMMKLDPRNKEHPQVWKIDDQSRLPSGVWGTPALHKDVVYFDTDGGELLAADRKTGDVRWRKRLPGPTWQSPVVVDDVLLVGDCQGTMHAYDVSNTAVDPPQLWEKKLGGCIESTPAVWKGRIYFGTRGGSEYALAAK